MRHRGDVAVVHGLRGRASNGASTAKRSSARSRNYAVETVKTSVLTCRLSKRGLGGKSSRFPELAYLERLYARDSL
jgi:hypothetical protein